MSRRLGLIILGLAALFGLLAAESPAGVLLDRRLQDVARLLRSYLQEPSAKLPGPVVVIALDEESHLRPPFSDLPRALWSPHLATVIEAALDVGARVVGLDLILATSAEPVLRGYDRPLLKALRRGADAGRLVLAAVQDPNRPLYPAPMYVFALRRNSEHIRPANLPADPDGIVRRAPIQLPEGGLGFAAELARRGGASLPAGSSLTLDPPNHPVPVTTLSFADLHACAEAGQTERLRALLGGRVVIIGAMLADIDRFRSANWLALDGVERLPDRRCVEPPDLGGMPTPAPRTMAGVQLHALAVEQLLTGRLPQDLPAVWSRVAALGISLLAALPVVLRGVTPLMMVLTALAVAAPLPAAAATLPGMILPAGRLGAAALAAAATALILREALVDRALRRLRRGFALYLPTPVVDRMLAQSMPELGGELREVTILFADLAGYTGIAERTPPPQLAAMLNRHFARLGAAVEREGGFVLQYLGDGMLAVFGAPAQLAEHPTAAVDAALASLAAVEAERRLRLRLRIGIATGEAVVGNIGSPHRFNYAVVGDVVNLAARLEGLNKDYGTRILVAEATAARYAGRHTLREIDRVLAVGRETPLAVFEPRREGNAARDQAYARALAAYRAADFPHAADLFDALAPADAAAAVMARRSRSLAVHEPEGWDGVFRPTRK